jgi:hypothetical protein
MWTEIDIERIVSSRDLQAAFAATFGVAPTRILITEDIASEGGSDNVSPMILVEQRTQPGDFPQRLMIVLKDPELVQRVGDRETSIKSYSMLSLLAANMKSTLLAVDQRGDPYSALLIEPTGKVYHVDLDPDFMDETDGVRVEPEANRIPDSRLSHLGTRQSMVS